MSETPVTVVPLIEESLEVSATPQQVWEKVRDLSAMSRWSPQVVRTWVRGGSTRQGSSFVSLNRRGWLFWPTRGKVLDFLPGERLAFRIKDNRAIWSVNLAATETGTRIVQRRETPQGLSPVSSKVTDLALGGQKDFTAELRAGMRQTLTAIEAELS